MLHPRAEWPDGSLDKEVLIQRFESLVSDQTVTHSNCQPIELRFNELDFRREDRTWLSWFGTDFDILQRTADQIALALRGIPGLPTCV